MVRSVDHPHTGVVPIVLQKSIDMVMEIISVSGADQNRLAIALKVQSLNTKNSRAPNS